MIDRAGSLPFHLCAANGLSASAVLSALLPKLSGVEHVSRP